VKKGGKGREWTDGKEKDRGRETRPSQLKFLATPLANRLPMIQSLSLSLSLCLSLSLVSCRAV